MPRRSKAKGLYQRGPYWLDWDRKRDGTLRSPNLGIFWYDPERGRIRSVSAGTGDDRDGRKALDRHYLSHTEGQAICPTCGQRRTDAEGSYFVTDAIADYLAMRDDATLEHRLAHVLAYIGSLPTQAIRCRQVDEAWVARFRTWSLARPVIHTSGRVRAEPRSASTIENSLIALAAAINAAAKRGDTSRPAQFRPIQTRELNNTPKRRLSVDEIAAAFRYALDPRFPTKRAGLLRFLRISIGTLCRPDAAHDFSTAPDRQQWNSERRVVALNPKGRRQTKKYRATVIAPWQLAQRIDETNGFFVPVKSIRSAWDSMCDDLGWPKDGENGTKLIRRSGAQLLRDPARKVPTEQIELLLGHRKIDSVTDLYAAFDPVYLADATRALEALIDEIEIKAPGAFHRNNTGNAVNIVPIGASKKAS